MTEIDWIKFWKLFHTGWGHAKDSFEYRKEIWNEMHSMMLELARSVEGRGLVERRKGERRNQDKRTPVEKAMDDVFTKAKKYPY